MWTTVIIGAVVLGVLLVFILQNLQSTTVQFFTVQGSLPLALAMLFATIAGALVTGLIGTARILQLRRAARRGTRG